MPTASSVPAAAEGWSTFRGDAAHRAEAAQGPIGHPVLRWRFQANGSVDPPPSVVGGIVYAVSDDGILHAISDATGKELWSFTHASSGQVGATIVSGTAYVTDRDGVVWAVDAVSGAEQWHSAAKVPGGLVVADGSIFVSGVGSIQALDAATGTQRWKYSAPGGVPDQFHVPAYAGGTVYASGDSSGLIALDGKTGSLRWHADTGSGVTGTVVVADGIVYVGTGEASQGHLLAFDAATGAKRWSIDEPIFSPAVSAGVAYSGSSNGYVSAHDTATGRQLWRFPVQGTARPLGVASGVVYVPADDEHRVYALDAKTGAELWHFDVDGGIDGSLAIANGSVYVGTSTGGVYAIGGDGSTVVGSAAPPAGATAPPAATPAPSNAAQGPSPAQLLWIGTGAAGDGLDWPNGMTIDPNGRLWVASTGQNAGPGHSRLAIFNPDVTTSVLEPGPVPQGLFQEYWGTSGSGDGQFDFVRPNGDGYGSVQFAPDGSFYVLDTGNRRIEHFDKSRTLIGAWGGFGTGPGKYVDPVGLAVDTKGLVHVLDDGRSVVETTDATGHVLSSFPEGTQNCCNGMALDSAGNVYLATGGDSGNQVLEYGPTGALRQSIGPAGAGSSTFDAQVGAVTVDDQGRIFVGLEGSSSTDNVLVFDKDGHPLSSFGPTGTGPGQIGFVFDLLLDGHGGLYVADASNNRVEKYRLLGQLSARTPIDGTWQMCFTQKEWLAARDAGKLDPTDPPSLDDSCFTVRFSQGLTYNTVGSGSYAPLPATAPSDAVAYVVSGNRLTLYQPTGEVFLYTLSLTNGHLTFANVPPGWSGPTWLLVKPFATVAP